MDCEFFVLFVLIKRPSKVSYFIRDETIAVSTCERNERSRCLIFNEIQSRLNVNTQSMWLRNLRANHHVSSTNKIDNLTYVIIHV